jgi:membrane-associated protease RseP (regulator of RpoE activity)
MSREIKNLNSDEQIVKLLGGLKRVEAPSDFDVKVRSGIARFAPRTGFGRAELLLGLKFALPALVLAAFGAFLAFSNLSDVDSAAVPPIEDLPSIIAKAPDPAVEAPYTGTEEMAGNNLTARTSDVNAQAPAVSVPTRKNAESPGGSKDQALTQANDPVFPRGLNPNARVDDTRGVSPGGDGVSVREILSVIGINSECDQAGCKVAGVAKNGMAERSGIISGDVIEAIDDKPVNSSTVFKGSVAAKNLQVLRGGKRLTISLKTR